MIEFIAVMLCVPCCATSGDVVGRLRAALCTQVRRTQEHAGNASGRKGRKRTQEDAGYHYCCKT